MNKQQQEQKKIQDAQKQAAKNQVEQRNQALLQKEFYVREWKAEIDLMNYEMEYFNLIGKYKNFKDTQKAIQAKSQPKELIPIDETQIEGKTSITVDEVVDKLDNNIEEIEQLSKELENANPQE